MPEADSLSDLNKIGHILCVASGKGGVGKSTTAVNLALALACNAKVGVLDADIYGPSIPTLLGVPAGTRPEVRGGKTMVPIRAHGLLCNSMGFLVDQSTAMVWRAPMIISAFNQILNDTAWSDLDYLIVDLPPGTGDIQLSLSQAVRVSGAVIVTTPQDLALLDARRGIEMFRKVSVPVLGVVENMSVHICSKCGHEEAIFGAGGGDRLARDFEVPVLARPALDPAIREASDLGEPLLVKQPGHPANAAWLELASGVAERCAGATAQSAPKITITDD
ncbi:MAG: iron-sulfur cluster carrier protein ApbC [Gammaproteobacteria bacterium]|nr:iron-sulfur cluster carrier protein ApbC [Gammaproteobacteria bacterium]MYH47503.1 iron-sulfur cluster carrier protein ApbC [Gammaproteobacteria bacterium]MYL12314.1 iron-sulfur cluster carrier protein ApbC [Gammaproteobacteria bacterium]